MPPHLKDLIQRRERLHAKRRQEINEAADKQQYRSRKKFSSQIGAIVFVDEYNTSKNCPYCGESISWKSNIADKLKFKQHRFSCGKESSCGFDTDRFAESPHAEPPLAQPPQGEPTPDFEVFREIDDPDKVAAYNVAGKIQDWKKIARFSDSEEAHRKDQSRG